MFQVVRGDLREVSFILISERWREVTLILLKCKGPKHERVWHFQNEGRVPQCWRIMNKEERYNPSFEGHAKYFAYYFKSMGSYWRFWHRGVSDVIRFLPEKKKIILVVAWRMEEDVAVQWVSKQVRSLF